MSQALRKLTGAINRSKTALVFTNQLREKIGVMFGNLETTWRPRPEVLRQRAPGHPPHRDAQDRDRCGRLPHPASRWSRTRSPRWPGYEFDIMYNEASAARRPARRGHRRRGPSKTGAWFNYGDTRSARAARTRATS